MNTFIDIECIPEQPEDEAKAKIAEWIQPPANMSKQETIAAWHNGEGKYEGAKDAAIDEHYLKSVFNAAKGEIVSIAWAIEDDEINVVSNTGEGERFVLDYFFTKLMDQLKGRPPFFIGYNLGNFDLPYIYKRAVIKKIRPPFDLQQWGRHPRNFYDCMIQWCGQYSGVRISQDSLCEAFGIETDNMDGSQVYELYKAGKFGKIESYNQSHV